MLKQRQLPKLLLVLQKIDQSKTKHAKIVSSYYPHCYNSLNHFNKKQQCYINIFGGFENKKTHGFLEKEYRK